MRKFVGSLLSIGVLACTNFGSMCQATNFLDEHQQWLQEDHRYVVNAIEKRKHLYSREGIIRLAFRENFEIKRLIARLRTKNAQQHVRIGKALPRLNLRLGSGEIPVDFGSLLGGALEFIMPHNWLNLVSARVQYRAVRYQVLAEALELYRKTNKYFFEAHKKIREIEIIGFYENQLKQFLADVSQEPELDSESHIRMDILTSYLVQLELKKHKCKEEVNLDFHAIESECILGQKNQEKFSIADLCNIESELADIKNTSLDSLKQTALKKSPKLKMLKELVREAKLGVGIGLSREMLSPNGEDAISIAFGYDTIPRAIVLHGDKSQHKIDLKEEIYNTEMMTELTILERDHALESIEFVKSKLTQAKNLYSNSISFFYANRRLPESTRNFIEDLISLELSLNEAYHEALMSKVNIEVLEADPVLRGRLLRYLPKKHETKTLINWYKRHHLKHGVSRFHYDQQIRRARSVQQLSETILSAKREHGRDLVSFLLKDNLGYLLKSGRKHDFYLELGNLIDEYKIKLGKREKLKLFHRKHPLGRKLRKLSEKVLVESYY